VPQRHPGISNLDDDEPGPAVIGGPVVDVWLVVRDVETLHLTMGKPDEGSRAQYQDVHVDQDHDEILECGKRTGDDVLIRCLNITSLGIHVLFIQLSACHRGSLELQRPAEAEIEAKSHMFAANADTIQMK
jgi:hypothetical protein